MTITIDLPPDVAERLARKATQDGQDLAGYVQGIVQHASIDAAEVASQLAALSDRPVPQSLDDVQPRTPPPPGKTAMQMIRGQWPGDETEEELLAQLRAMG